MKKTRRFLSEEYDLVSWTMRIFLGGVFETVIIGIFVQYFIHNLPPLVNGTYYLGDYTLPQSIAIWSLLILIGVCPLIISLLFSKLHPKLRIVPPFYIAMVAVGFSLAIWGIANVSNFALTFLGGACLLVIGFMEDVPAITIFGKATERQNIFFEKLTIYADIEEVKSRLSVPEIKKALYLSDKVDGDSERGYLFKADSEYSFSLRISLTKSKEYYATTTLKITYYNVEKYALTTPPDFFEEMTKTSLYLQNILAKRKPILPFAVDTELSNENEDALVDCVIDDMRGYYVKAKTRITKGDWFKIGVIVVIAIVVGVLFTQGQPTYATLAGILDALIVISQLPDLLKHQS